MKFTIEQEKKEFRPIELKITIESKEELMELWHRFNLGKADVTDRYKEKNRLSNVYNFPSRDKFYSLWRELDSFLGN